jgi:hypothetical protein
MRAYHSLIHGTSGSGKTTLLREIAHNTPSPVIIVNHTDERDFPGQRASGRDAMQNAAAKYSQWSDVRINLRVDDVFDGMKLARSYAVDLWDTVRVPCRIIVDEAHTALPDGANGDRDNPANWMLAEGRDKGIVLTLCTQNPHNLDKTELLNLRYWCPVGPPAEIQRGFIDYYGYPERVHDLDRMEYLVLNKQMDVEFEGETKERFA